MSEDIEQGYSRVAQVCNRFNISPASVWRKSREGTFPRPYKLSAGRTAWKNSEVLQWEKDPLNYGRGAL
jgi:predicted DNA-binding transcriptional regulator AlpA